MITIIHGDDLSISRVAFSDLRDKDSITYDAQNLSLVELAQTLQGSGLFKGGNKIFIENLFTNKAKNVEEITNLLNSGSKDNEIFLFADKELPAKTLKPFKNTNVQIYKIPQTIWAFVDGIRPNSPGNVNLFRKAIDTTEVEIVFSMIIRQFRLLLGLDSEIDEVKRLQDWQKGKLIRQKSLFGEDKLEQIMKKLYRIDRSTKTGTTPLTLTQSIDILMLEI